MLRSNAQVAVIDRRNAGSAPCGSSHIPQFRERPHFPCENDAATPNFDIDVFDLAFCGPLQRVFDSVFDLGWLDGFHLKRYIVRDSPNPRESSDHFLRRSFLVFPIDFAGEFNPAIFDACFDQLVGNLSMPPELIDYRSGDILIIQ